MESNTLKESLDTILNEIMSIAPEMAGSAVINSRGQIMAMNIPETTLKYKKGLGAMVVSFLGTSKSISDTLMSSSTVLQSYFQTERGYLFVYEVDKNHTLAVLAKNDVPLGLVDWAITAKEDNIVVKLQNILK